MLFHKIISTGLGIGYIGKGAGTYASIATCICWYFFQVGYIYPNTSTIIITILLLVQGVRSSDKVEEIWGKDHGRVVIDEISGMCITLLFVPIRWEYILLGLILFRFFDILKPLYIRRLESLPGGWGVMADDVLAGIYSNLVIQVILLFGLF